MKISHHNFGHLLITALSIALVTGCMKESAGTSDTSGMITVGFSVEGMRAGTYSTAAEGHELTVNDVHILFYEMKGASSGGYITYQHATVAHGVSTFSFPIPDALIPKTDYRTIIVGNAHSFVPSGYASFDAYLNACKAMTYDEAKEKIYAEMTGNSMLYLPMWGLFVNGEGAETPFRFENRTNGEVKGTIHLSRSVCRLDLKNHAANSLNIAWVKVCNFRSKGYYFHNDSPYGEIRSGLTSTPPSGVGDGYVRVSEAAGGVQELKAALYAFANIVPIVAQNDDQTTYLMIAGYYQNGVTPNTTKLTYYRFNIAELGRSQILKRNYIYRASIQSVKGAGADTEQGAKDETSPLLEYQVDDEWSDNEDDTATDEFGNYLILSRTQISFNGLKNTTETVKVKVKEGMTWEVVDDHQPTDQIGGFSFMKANSTSFSITTLLDNSTVGLNNGHLKVVATTTQGTKLEVGLSLMQLSTAEETNILLVDGRNGTITRRIAGSGGTLSLQVQTGSSYARWTATDNDNELNTWPGTSFTGSGADKGFLNINVPANITADERTATLVVHRSGTADVTIKLTQPKSDKLLTVSPMPANGTLIAEGFSTSADNPDGLSFQKVFWAMLADPMNYTLTVSSNFDCSHDLRLSTQKLLATEQATFPATPQSNVLTGLLSGEQFWVNVYRTGPGDPTIKGMITVKATPKTAGLPEQEVSFSVHIVTSCAIGDAQVTEDLLVADRNVGALPRIDESGGFVPALNFSTYPELKITGYLASDHENTQFRGAFYNWFTVANYSNATHEPLDKNIFCPELHIDPNIDKDEVYSPYYKSEDREKWHAPTKEEMTTIYEKFIYSKQRPFLLSIKKNAQDKYVGCFFTKTGTIEDSTSASTYYWTTSTGNGRYYFKLTGMKSYVATILDSSPLYSTRCVRTLP